MTLRSMFRAVMDHKVCCIETQRYRESDAGKALMAKMPWNGPPLSNEQLKAILLSL